MNRNYQILNDWLSLFQFPQEEEDEIAEEILLCAILEIGEFVINHFAKVLFSEKLRQFKNLNQHQKRQALRPSLLPERKKRCLPPKLSKS